ncbi:MAG: DegT/DnrJ/EryC1/StrS family aminotransferase [Candidatus Omnitrophica bacterium]|nr:DegT/DnrJ/EryC1/StrS family aminotransferase [Candidatus Omnitrophota bacterium]
MITTDDETLAKRAKHLSTQAKSDPIEYFHDEIGYNYRLTNIQAALGLAQMEKIDTYINQKQKIARRYQEKLKDMQGLCLKKLLGQRVCGGSIPYSLIRKNMECMLVD